MADSPVTTETTPTTVDTGTMMAMMPIRETTITSTEKKGDTNTTPDEVIKSALGITTPPQPNGSSKALKDRIHEFIDQRLTFSNVIRTNECNGIQCFMNKMDCYWRMSNNNSYWTLLFHRYLEQVRGSVSTGHLFLIEDDVGSGPQWIVGFESRDIKPFCVLHTEMWPLNSQQHPALVFVTHEANICVTTEAFYRSYASHTNVWERAIQHIMHSPTRQRTVLIPSNHLFAFLLFFHAGVHANDAEGAVDLYLREQLSNTTLIENHLLYLMNTIDVLFPQDVCAIQVLLQGYQRRRDSMIKGMKNTELFYV